MAHKLDNYLKTHRKRAGLTQDEVAFLLGYKNGTKISRLEKSICQPDFRTALALQVFFGTPANEIFPGIFSKVETEVSNRARLLSRKLCKTQHNPVVDYKLKVLHSIASGKASEPNHEHEKIS